MTVSEIDDATLEELEAIRRSGKTNMLDREVVGNIATEVGFHNLAAFVDAVGMATYTDALRMAPQKFGNEDINKSVPDKVTITRTVTL
jgi:hypothetical protein